ncbi:MAG TPA: tetratricopeptide repeat protein [Armatimonadota bacterium]|jgi:tetratricopeptide (TPR) repeat protein
MAALDAGHYEEAATQLAQAVQASPNNEPAWYSLGVARFKSDPPDYPGALEALRAALKLAPNRPGTRLYIGRIYESQGAFAEAIAIYEEELSHSVGADKVEAQVALGRADYRAGRPQAARDILLPAVTAEPKYVEGLYWLGLSYTALRDYPNAVKTFRQAQDVLRDYSDLQASLHRLKSEQQREHKQTEEKLAQEFGRAQEFAQDLGLWPALNKALGDAYLGDQQYDLARIAYRHGLDKNQLGNPSDADVYVLLARAYLADAQQVMSGNSLLYTAIGTVRSAEQAADKAISLDAKSAGGYEVKGEVYAFQASSYNADPKQKITSHSYADAMTAFDKALELQPDNIKALVESARTYIRMAQTEQPGSDESKKDLTQAQGRLQQALTLQPEVPGAYVLLAQASLLAEDYPQSQQLAEKALALDNKNPGAYDVAGLSMYYQNRLPEAARYFRDGIAIQDGDPQLHFNLGNTFFQMKSWFLALKEYEKALAHTPFMTLAKTSYQRAYIYYQIGLVYHEIKRYDAEIDSLNNGLALDASYFDAYLQLARAYAAQQQFRGAQRALDQAQQRADDAQSARAYLLSGQIYEMAGDPHSAAAAYSSALNKDASNAVAQQALARLTGQ